MHLPIHPNSVQDLLNSQEEAQVNRSERMPRRRNIGGQEVALAVVAALVAAAPVASQTGGTASDGPGVAAAWTTGNKMAVGTSADTTSKVWFTVAKGITTEVFYPRLDVPNMQDMQYIVTDGSTFVDLERDATSHVTSMPAENALERKTVKYKFKLTAAALANKVARIVFVLMTRGGQYGDRPAAARTNEVIR